MKRITKRRELAIEQITLANTEMNDKIKRLKSANERKINRICKEQNVKRENIELIMR